MVPVTEPNNGLCANGSQPTVTTPAAATGFVFQGAINATPQQVAAANDITGVLNAVLNSSMTSLASTAVNAANQLVNQSLSSLNNGSSITAGATPPPANLAGLASSTSATAGTVSSIPLACNPSSQTIPSPTAGNGTSYLNTTSTMALASSTNASGTSPTSISATGGTFDENGNPPTYSWSDSNGVTGTGAFFSDIFATPGTYNVTLTDSASDTPSVCTVTVQP